MNRKNIGFSHRPFLGAVVSERLPPKLLGMSDKKFKEVAVTVAFIVVASLTSLFCKRGQEGGETVQKQLLLASKLRNRKSRQTLVLVSRQTDNKKVEKIAELGI